MLQTLAQLFEQWSGEPLLHAQELTPSGSARHYFRLRSATRSAVGCEGSNLHENRAFISLARHFAARQLPVPEVLAASNCGAYYLQQDLGDLSLFDLVADGRSKGAFSTTEKAALAAALAALAQLQYVGAQGLDYAACCYPQAAWGRSSVMWDLSYFKYCFLKPRMEDMNEALLEENFAQLADFLAEAPNSGFMHRDFQSRNVMWRDEKPYLIDFQAGREGPPAYDVASFLYQAKANFPDDLRRDLLQAYLAHAAQLADVDAAAFAHRLPAYALLRTLQVLGAYGFRGGLQRKPHFLQSIPPALENLRSLLAQPLPEGLRLPYLREVAARLHGQQPPAPAEPAAKLRVQVLSFSYRRGLPDDPTGNGGGFIFDCRSIPNPGRQEEYRLLTGLDLPVAQHLDRDEHMQDFLRHAVALAQPAVERYHARGFQHLMLAFGCTGGQHRSVYAAQRTAERLRRQHPQVDIEVIHREQKISTLLP